ncbi:MAG: GNAT family protein [Pseudomonadota bacterium]
MTLQIRRFRKRDIEPLFAWFETERDVLEWAGASLSWPLKRREFIEMIKHHRGADSARELWAVTYDQDMVAHFQVTYYRRLNTAGLGRIAVAPWHRGKRLSDPLMDLILNVAFRRDWIHRVDLLVYAHNVTAIHAYERAGFVYEGTRRQTTPIADEIWDTAMMSLLRHEFDKRTERE